jgi:hypothetical protein
MLARTTALCFALFSLPSLAAAESADESAGETEPASKSAAAPVDDDTPAPFVLLAHDTLTGHFQAGVSPALTLPFGQLESGDSAADLGPGYGAKLDLGFGVARGLSLGAWGELFTHSAHSACRVAGGTPVGSSNCSALDWAVGPFVRYHLVQGMRFDPWFVLGPGYHVLTVDTAAGKQRFSGVDWLKIAAGGDYYLLSGFGIGPWVELDVGRFDRHPAAGSDHWHEAFTFGLRGVLDVPGR